MSTMRPGRAFQIVVAVTRNWGIGSGGGLPFDLPGDMKYFRQLTSQTSSPKVRNAVIMGRKTFLSIPEKFRPLKGRLNIVLTSQPPAAEDAAPAAAAAAADAVLSPVIRAGSEQQEVRSPLQDCSNKSSQQNQQQGQQEAKLKQQQEQQQVLPPTSNDLLYATSLDAAMQLLEGAPYSGVIETVFVIGGGQVYQEAVSSDRCSVIHLTKVDAEPACDTFFPDITAEGSQWRLWSSARPCLDRGIRYQFLVYTKEAPAGSGPGSSSSSSSKAALQDVVGQPPVLPPGTNSRHDEYQYLDLVKELIEEGNRRGDRTGTGTLSKFGVQSRYDLRHSFPLLTSKRVFWRGVLEELLWFIRGSTNARELQDKGVHIWDGNSSRAFLDAQGLTDREEGDLGPVYGFQWRHFGAQYKDMHTDYTGQGVDQLADLIQRIKATPEDRRLILTAWNPADLRRMALPPCHLLAQFYVSDGELSCQLYQRSADIGLGVPFNIASYALLTCMVAQVCHLKPGEFVHVSGDAHVYMNHVEPLKQQLLNVPRHFPRLLLNPEKMDIDDFVAEDFTLLDYQPHKTIKMQMAV
eukprot:gene6877-7093_t